MGKRMTMVMLAALLSMIALSVPALAEEGEALLRAEAEAWLETAYQDAELMDARWIESQPGSAAVTFVQEEHLGLAILERQENGRLTVMAHNDRLFPVREDMACVFDGWPGDDLAVWYETPDVSRYLRMSRKGDGTWYVSYFCCGDQGDESLVYSAREDGRFVVVYDTHYPQVWWPVEEDISINGFDVSAVRAMCRRAVSYMYDEAVREQYPEAYRVDWDGPDE